MSDRESADYELSVKIPPEQVALHLQSARSFVEEADAWLRREGWL
jgi:hypothetical protein